MIPAMKVMAAFVVALAGCIYFLYLRNLWGLLKSVQPANRRVRPSVVWFLAIYALGALVLLPFFVGEKVMEPYMNALGILQIVLVVFKLILNFYLVNKIAESLDAELKSRRIAGPAKPTLLIGMVMCICDTAALLAGVDILEVLAVLGSIAGFAAWIVYWTQTNGYRQVLKNEPPDTPLKDLGIDR